MRKFNFDEVIERKGTGAVKFDALKENFGREDLIPMWIADMDFLSPPTITDAIIKRAEHGIFGYTKPTQPYYDSIINWISTQHNWNIKQDWITFVPGVVKGIAFCTDCFSEKGEKVVIQPPVYPPFINVPTLRHRELVNNTLVLKDGAYHMDFELLEKQLKGNCKMLILCNPHNPGGRVWSREELERVADLCYDNNVIVISDEIHADLALQNHKHIPFASISEKAKMNSVTLMAPSKTFNIAGIISSYAIIPSDKIRAHFNAYMQASELDAGHIFAYTAAEAAYNTGEEWLKEAKEYIWENICFTKEYIEKNIPQIKVMIPEASFMLWLDCKELGMTQEELVSFFINEAKVAFNDGSCYGEAGIGYMRINIGTPKSVIEKALLNIKDAVNRLKK